MRICKPYFFTIYQFQHDGPNYDVSRRLAFRYSHANVKLLFLENLVMTSDFQIKNCCSANRISLMVGNFLECSFGYNSERQVEDKLDTYQTFLKINGDFISYKKIAMFG